MMRFAAGCVLLAGACLPMCAQDVCKVSVRAYVTTRDKHNPGRDGLLVAELPQERFQANLKPPARPGVSVRTDAPVNAIVLLDRSGSMDGSSSALTDETIESVLKVMTTDPGIRLASFGEKSAVATTVEAARKLASDLPTKLKANFGKTALWDAIEFRSRDFGEQGGTMLVVTDCGDNASKLSPDKLKRELQRRKVQVTFLALENPFPATLEDVAGVETCYWLSAQTGGLTVTSVK